MDETAKNNIAAHIRRGEYAVVENNSPRAKSDVWVKFGLVQDEDNNIVAGCAVCKACKKVLGYESRKLGTSSLKKHLESCPGQRAVTAVDRFVNKGLLPPSRQDKDDITKLAVEFVALDVRSFETVNGPGFKAIAQGLIDVGARSGRVDAVKLLPDPTTVSRNLTKNADDVREKLIPFLRQQVDESNAACTLDMWTDDYKKVAYLCVTLHYINTKWDLKERVLCTAEWDSTLRKTGEHLRAATKQILRKYNLVEFYNKLVYVTDRGSNIVAALSDATRLSCGAHILSTVLHTTLGKKEDADLFYDEVSALIDAAKSLVTYFKHTNLQSRVTPTLKASVETRWNSIHTMLDSIHCQYDRVDELLAERGEQHRLASLPADVLGDMITFLQRFRDATKDLEASTTPTLHLTAVWLDRLKKHLQPVTVAGVGARVDNAQMISLKRKCLRILTEKLVLTPLHKLALFLHPKLKSMKLLPSQDDVVAVHDEARRLVQGISCYYYYNYYYSSFLAHIFPLLLLLPLLFLPL